MLSYSYIINGTSYYFNYITVNTKDHHHLHVEYYDIKKVKEIKE